MNLPVYNGTIFSSFFTDQNLTPVLNNKKKCKGHVTKIPRDDGLLSEPSTDVNGDDPYSRHNSAHSTSIPTANLVYTKEVAIGTTVSHMINMAGIIYCTCTLVIEIKCTRYKRCF